MNQSCLRPSLGSAAIGAGYALGLHLMVWIALSVAYLAVPSNGNHAPLLIAPAAVMTVGVLLFVYIKSLPVKPWCFYIAFFVAHILLAVLFFAVSTPWIELLQAVKGFVPPAGEPEANLDFLYFLLIWVLLAVGVGAILFVLTVAFLVRDHLRSLYGAPPRRRKKKDKERNPHTHENRPSV